MVALPATPGVHVQRAEAGRPRAQALRTDVAGFAGFAEKGPIGTAVPVENMAQFEAIFGSFRPGHELAYAVRGFFENQGDRACIVRLASEAPDLGANASALQVDAEDGSPAFALEASTPGRWGDDLTASTRAVVADELLIPAQRRQDRSTVSTLGTFAEGDLVRLSQPGAATHYRLLAQVDLEASALIWLRDDLRTRQAWEAPLTGFDPLRPIRAERITHEIVLRRQGRPLAIYSDLGLHPASRRFIGDILAQPTFDAGGPREVPPIAARLPQTAPSAIPVAVGPDQGTPRPFSGGRDGHSAATLSDLIGRPDDGSGRHARGLHALAEAHEVSLMAVPDLVGRRVEPLVFDRPERPDPCIPCPAPDAVAAQAPVARPGEMPPRFSAAQIARGQAALITLCETAGDRIALLDPPWDAARATSRGTGPALTWRGGLDSSYAAALFPWVVVPDPARRREVRPTPPSGHVAGRIAIEDRTRGVPGSGANTPLGWITDTTVRLDARAHGRLNEAGLNALVVSHGRATRLAGARLATRDPAWRFVTPRRLVCAMRRQLPTLLDWAVFAPDDTPTRLAVARVITGYLEILRRRGALAGGTPQAAYSVRCDAITTTPQDVFEGRLVAQVAIAPTVPFEFIVLHLGRVADRIEIGEQPDQTAPLFSEKTP